jgi:HD superfamily phosphodiesterase
VASPDLARALDSDEAGLRPLPAAITELLVSLKAPARLAAHLRAVHDVAWQLTDRLATGYPALTFDRNAVLYGAASHDIGKIIHVDELTGPGSQHEAAGYSLLITHGVAPDLARFARSHASWTAPDTTIDDHLVSLADKIWKAKRVPDLEDLITAELATASGIERWQAFGELDDILTGLAAGADDRLAYQARHPVHPFSTP